MNRNYDELVKQIRGIFRPIFKGQKNKRRIKGLTFILSCSACPEQYDVFKGDEQVGYIRCRWGRITIEYPRCGDKLIYKDTYAEDGYRGILTKKERKKYLKIASKLINELLKEQP